MIFGLAAPALPDIATTGLNPYDPIKGNPIVALIAQLNRFVGRKVTHGSACYGIEPGAKLTSGQNLSVTYLTKPFEELPSLSSHAADTAHLILYNILTCPEDARMIDTQTRDAMEKSIAQMGEQLWVLGNLASVTVKLALFADSQGLPPAPVGITKAAPGSASSKSPGAPIGWILLGLGALAAGAALLLTRRAS
jgi:hypothetical protein